MHQRHIQPGAGGFQIGAQPLVDECRKHRPRLCLNPLQNPMQLKPCPHQTPPVIDDVRMVELHRGGACDGIQRLTGGVRNEVEIDLLSAHACRLPLSRVNEDSGDNCV